MNESPVLFNRPPLSRAVWTKGKSPGRFPGDAGSNPATATSLAESSQETPVT